RRRTARNPRRSGRRPWARAFLAPAVRPPRLALGRRRRPPRRVAPPAGAAVAPPAPRPRPGPPRRPGAATAPGGTPPAGPESRFVPTRLQRYARSLIFFQKVPSASIAG